MNRAASLVIFFLGAFGCSGNGELNLSLALVGTHDMVLVDELPADGSIATVTNGVPNQYLFVTSADRNELKVMRNSTAASPDKRLSVRAPDPLESLAIPVLTRPTTLFADEGLSDEVLSLSDGGPLQHVQRRVTGRFIYAIRTGGAELSVVDATPAGFAQVTESPLVLPAPITAGAAWMGVDLTTVPDTTSVYLATYDGSNGAVYRLTLPTDLARRGQVATVVPDHLLDVGPEPIVALAMVPPLEGRTFDEKAYCGARSTCIAIATRSNSGKEGRAFMVDLETLKTVALAFPGPVKSLKVAGRGRIHGLLDEAKCDSVSCGGAVVVDTFAGTSSDKGFPVMTDFSGQKMLPVVRAGALARDLAVATYHGPTVSPDAGLEWPLGIRQYSPAYDGGVVQVYDELGMFSASNGQIVVYDGINGVAADYNGERTGLMASTSTVTRNVVRIPGPVSDDGGLGFFYEDGGAAYTEIAMQLEEQDSTDGGVKPWRRYLASATYPSGQQSRFDVTFGDGYLFSQNILVANQGVIPGLVGLPTSVTDEQAVRFSPVLGKRVRVGDRVAFGVSLADGGTGDCGEAHVTSLDADAGWAQVDGIPIGCEARSLFTIRGGSFEPVIVSGDVEGYIGRATEQADFTSEPRRYVSVPAGYDKNLVVPAITMKIGVMPTEPGAYWLFTVDGALNPYRIQFDFSDATATTVAAGCATAVPGALTLAEVPTNSSTAGFSYKWNLITLFPYTNGVAYDPLELSVADAFGSRASYGLGAMCYR